MNHRKNDKNNGKNKNSKNKTPAAADANFAPFPSKEDVREFIHNSNTPLNKREIARAFHLKGQDRTALRQLMRELEEENALVQNPDKSWQAPDSLPETALIEIQGLDGDGELRAKPVQWYGKGPMPLIFVFHRKQSSAELKEGDQVLARLKKVGRLEYEARVMRDAEDTSEKIIGVFKPYKGGGYVYPTNKKIKEDYFVPAEFCEGYDEGDLVMAEQLPPTAKYPRSKNPARIIERLGKKDDPKLISLIAIHSHGIPTAFPKAVLAEAEEMEEPTLAEGRTDLRDIPLVTIDGVDARDFDDAVFAEPDADPKNPGGWHLIVAIADVSYYVRPRNALDTEAYKRGNSTYFADRVVPMLPERLSNDLCSLRPQVNRAALAVHMYIDKDAKLLRYKFVRGLIRSAARLTYEQVEEAHRGNPDDTTGPLMERVIRPLYKAYSLLKHAREKRGALELDLPERKAVIDKSGNITDIVPRQRLDSHQLIEEFMILANVSAAMALEDRNAPCVYRIHDKPSFDKLESTRDFLKEFGYSLPQSDNLQPKNLNHILKLSADQPDKALIHTILLRTQSQAVYSPENIGHFGLALEKYAHFTSPIRRYADLLVHRSLVRAFKLGEGGLTDDEADALDEISAHISSTERRSMIAERDVMDRFTAQYLSHNVGKNFQGRVSSVTHFGLFVSLDDSGADGIVPMRYLPRDYYVHDEKRHALVGKDHGHVFRLMDPVIVRLVEADPMRASTVFEIAVGGENAAPARDQRRYDDRKKGDRKHHGKRHKEYGRGLRKEGESAGAKGKGKARGKGGPRKGRRK